MDQNDKSRTDAERKANDIAEWIQRNKTNLLTVALFVTALQKRSLKKENAKLLVDMVKLQSRNMQLVEVLEKIQIVGSYSYKDLLGFYVDTTKAS
jgi:hypothetical protein